MSKLDDLITAIQKENLTTDQLISALAASQIQNDNQAATIISLNSMVDDLNAQKQRQIEEEQAEQEPRPMTPTETTLADHEARFKEPPRSI